MFRGVRFVLIGFDSVSEAQYRSELLNGAGIDVGRYDTSCTHVIVHDRVYDDPICIAARCDGKTLVTHLWVEDSLDIGSLADACRILYRPVKDLKGIPGSETLYICLTGYQRQDRDDIMKMVELMGAQFSKPLIASKVTHLICYKFEGEKYELARKIGIKLVNHRWLEDCLRTWEILPVDKYNKSGWELEIMEAEARDSEEETEQIGAGLSDLHSGTLFHSSELPTPVREAPIIKQYVSAGPSHITEEAVVDNKLVSTVVKDTSCNRPPDLCGFNNMLVPASNKHSGYDKSPDLHGVDNILVSSPHKESCPTKGADLYGVNNTNIEGNGYHDISSIALPGNGYVMTYARINEDNSSSDDKVTEPNNEGDTPLSDMTTSKLSQCLDSSFEKQSVVCFSRNSSRKSAASLSPKPSLPLKSSSHLRNSPQGHLEKNKAMETFDVSPLAFNQDRNDFSSCEAQTAHTEIHHKEDPNHSVPQKRKLAALRSGLGLPKARDHSASGSPQTTAMSVEAEHTSMMVDEPHSKGNPCLTNKIDSSDGVPALSGIANQHVNTSKTKPLQGELPVLGSEVSGNCGFPSDGKVTEFPCDAKSVYRSGVRATISDTVNYLGEMFIDNRSTEETNKPEPMAIDGRSIVEALNEQKMPVTSSGGSKESLAGNKHEIGLNKSLKVRMFKTTADAGKLSDRNDMSSSSKTRTKLLAKKATGVKHRTNKNASKGNSAGHLDETITPNETGEGKNEVESKKMNVEAGQVKDEAESEKMNIEVEGGGGGVESEKKNIEADKCKVLVESEKTNDNVNNEMINSACEGSDATKGEKVKIMPWSLNKSKRKIVALNVEVAEADAEKGNKLTENGGQMNVEAEQVMDGAESEKMNIKTEKSRGRLESEKIDIEAEKGKDRAEAENMNVDVNSEIANSACKRSNIIKAEKAKIMQWSTNKSKSKTVALDVKMAEVDAEKENKPAENDCQNVNSRKQGKWKAAVKKSNKVFSKINEKVDGTELDRLQAVTGSTFGSFEPAWFILSGHRLQRKEFQQVIRHLRGKLCRDSHHWSYQATHFIVPDPVRRTEKFFAAAAAGRWILKTDYLTASNDAGRFLEVEPFEWFKSGLSEDGAINLEAPRKWRTLRERTGHGALYGMRIVIYGECIAPPLETMKRVLKAGDGTILATSPPYTRFLKSGIDYAVISPGMPRIDCWVQEFIRHEIPCVTADYLVEYVCKPGYSLERHVLFKTHVWAEKSFANLLSRSEEIVEASTPSEESDNLVCEVCGSHDRGEVMLICGDEGGARGCGLGTHIDCCDPPMEAVPEEDWFCSKCRSGHNKTPGKGSRKGSLLKCK